MPRAKDISGLLKEFDQSFGPCSALAGIDEAGRGPLAGPVVCACVVMDGECTIPFVNDSKKLSPKRREELSLIIKEESVAWSVGVVDNETIDKVNILNATRQAMKQAISNLEVSPDIILIDGNNFGDLGFSYEAIVKGDSKSFAIACASIIAKVTRDKMMEDFDAIYPGYGFSSHKGYGTKAHYEAIRSLGFSPIHRMSFLKKLH